MIYGTLIRNSIVGRNQMKRVMSFQENVQSHPSNSKPIKIYKVNYCSTLYFLTVQKLKETIYVNDNNLMFTGYKVLKLH